MNKYLNVSSLVLCLSILSLMNSVWATEALSNRLSSCAKIATATPRWAQARSQASSLEAIQALALEPFPQGELRDLIARYQTDAADHEALELIIRSNLKLVFRIVKKYDRDVQGKARVIEKVDLIMAGIRGLTRATGKFDLDSGFAFSTYANFWVRSYVNQEFTEYKGPISLSHYRSIKLAQMKRITKNSPKISDLELQAELGVKAEDLAVLRELMTFQTESIQQIGDDTYDPLSKIPDPGAQPDEAQVKINATQLTDQMLSILTEKQALVLRLRFGIDTENGQEMTQQEIAAILNMSRQNVSLIEKQALLRLAKWVKAQNYNAADFLD